MGLLAGVALTAGAGAGTARAAVTRGGEDTPRSSEIEITGAPSLVTGSWSGYVTTQGPFYGASADFTVPGATCPSDDTEDSATNFWVGIQGTDPVTGQQDIAQTGFVVLCNQGQPQYYGTHADLSGNYSLTPQLGQPSLIAQPMAPGDQVSASVVCLFGICVQTVQDLTQNWSDDLVLPVPQGFSGWIAAIAGESSCCTGGVNTGPVQVTGAMVNGTPIGQLNPQADEQCLANYNGTAGLDPTALDPTGTIFDFYWNGTTFAGTPRSVSC